MNIIICGAGRVGFTIAKLLVEQNHSITVIDQSSEDIQKINDSLDVKAIVGKATYPSVLEKANATEADMIIAVTKNDEINMLVCQIAYTTRCQRWGVWIIMHGMWWLMGMPRPSSTSEVLDGIGDRGV